MTIVFQNDQTLQDTFSYHRDVRTYTSEYFQFCYLWSKRWFFSPTDELIPRVPVASCVWLAYDFTLTLSDEVRCNVLSTFYPLTNWLAEGGICLGVRKSCSGPPGPFSQCIRSANTLPKLLYFVSRYFGLFTQL